MRWMEKMKSIIEAPEDEADEGASACAESAPGAGRPAAESSRSHDKVVSIHATTTLQVYIIKPQQFEDAGSIADRLKNMHTLILNMEDTNRDIALRLMDFLGGVAYAYNGQIRQIASNTFLVAPYNVELMGSLLDDVQSSDWNMPEPEKES